jgi:hypothetical protein
MISGGTCWWLNFFVTEVISERFPAFFIAFFEKSQSQFYCLVVKRYNMIEKRIEKG